MTVTSMDASIADARSQIMAFLATDKGDAKRRVLISLGMNLLLDGSTADPPLKVPPGAVAYTPKDINQEAALCLLLATTYSQDKANQDVANTLFWRACLAAGYVLQWHALYQTLPHVKADAWTKKHIWEAQIQVAVAARQWPTAQAALRTLLLDWEDDVPGLLLAAKVGIIAGKEHYRQAYDQARLAVKLLSNKTAASQRSTAVDTDTADAGASTSNGGGGNLTGASNGTSNVEHLRPRALMLQGVAAFAIATQVHVVESERTALLEESLSLLSTAATADPHDPIILYSHAVALAHARQLTQAIRTTRACIAASQGGHIGGWCLLGLLLGAQGRFGLAIQVLGAAVVELGGVVHPLVLQIMARLHMRMGAVDKALECLSSLLGGLQSESGALVSERGAPPSDTEMDNLHLKLWCELARVFLLAGRMEDAAYCIQAAAEVKQWAPEVPYLQGQLARAKGDHPTALRCFETCRAIDPGFARCAITLGELHLAQAQALSPQAAEAISPTLRPHSTDMDGAHAMHTPVSAASLAQPPVQRSSSVASSVASSLRMQGGGAALGGASPLGNLSGGIMSGGNTPLFLEDCRQESELAMAEMFLKSAMQYEPDRAEGWYRLGLVYKQQQRLTDADAALRKAVRLALTAPVVRFAELPLLV